MKSESDLHGRLKKLRLRYLNRYLNYSQSRHHQNCQYNQVHIPRDIEEQYVPTEYELVPRKQTTLIVIQEESPIRLCMYEADKTGSWGGTICDNNEVSDSCPYFTPKESAEDAKNRFDGFMADDDYVLTYFKDIATLQWVLGIRVASQPYSLFERFFIWITTLFLHPKRILPAKNVDIPEDLWRDPS